MNASHPILAREGWPFIVPSLVLAVAVSAAAGWAWGAPLWLVAAFVVQFFRDPRRRAPQDVRGVLSPADGRVVALERVRDPYLDRDAVKLSVFMNVFDVHSNRSPVSGEVRRIWYHPGAFLNAALDKASTANERNAIWLRTDDGHDVVCVQVAGLVARRILCYAKEGERLARGDRYGFIRFGSRLDVYLEPGARIRATLGQKVRAGLTVLAEIGS